jgi:iron complex outermembrane receptor protein/outer membrane receptor for ferric coprogen and ferric-rhodotorulic acid
MTFLPSRNRRQPARARFLLGRLSLALLSLTAAPAATLAAEAAVVINSARQPLHEALVELGRQTSMELLYDPALVAGKTAPPVAGRLTPQQALDRLLAGSGLIAVVENGKAVIEREPDNLDAATLSAITVTARRAEDGTTEGTGSYTSRVTSTASKTDLAFREVPQSVSVVTRQQIDDEHLTSVSDALTHAAGITVQRAAYNSYNFFSRGFQITSMQIDGGAPLALGAYTYDGAQDLAFYDRVEVMRGASGLLGGMGDPGGIINLVRKRPLAEYQLTMEASAGSWDNYRSMIDATGPLGFDGRLRGRAVAVYGNSDSYLDDRHSESPMIYGVLEADLTRDTLLTVGGSYTKTRERGYGSGLPRYADGSDIGLSRSASLTQPWALATGENKQIFAQLEQRFLDRWKLKLNYTQERRNMRSTTAFGYGAIDPADGSGSSWGGGRYVMDNEQTVFDANLSGSFDLFGQSHEVLLGADWQRAEGRWNTGKPADNWQVPVNVFDRNAWNPDLNVPLTLRYDPWGQEQKGIYGVLRINPTSRLHLIAGARMSRYKFFQSVSDRPDGASAWEVSSRTDYEEPTKTTPYGGIIYDLNDSWSVYASYSTIHKPQGLLKSGPPPGSSLSAIKGKSYEAGLKGELLDGRLNATLSLFNVERTGTGVVDPRYPESSDPWAGNCCYRAQGKVVSRGVDLEIGGEVTPGWEVALGYTFNNSKDKSEGTVFSTVTPRHLFKLSTAYTLPGSLSRWRVGGNAVVQSSTFVSGAVYAPNGDATPYKFAQSGYAVVGLMAQYRFDPSWTLTLNANNLFDKVYYERVGDAAGGNWYGAPRNWMLTLRGTY